MCGIAGIVRLDGGTVDKGQLDMLTDALAHRGPDGRGAAIDGNVGLGHRRLSIVDLTAASSQPMRSENGTITLTFNGELYGYQEQRKALEAKGHVFTSSGDTEVLLRLYDEYGPDCVRHIRGMFAFAVHDRKRNILFLARDRVGKKPIKYFRSGDTFAFASELKALKVLPDCPRGIDREAIHHFLTMMYLPSPLTGFEGIKKLPAAHTLTVNLSTGEEKLERYWELRYEPDHRATREQWMHRIRDAFEESVRLRMVADVPVGAFLSGGVDSAAVVAFMARCSDRPVKTFSIGSEDPAFDELPQAREIADAFSTEHHPIQLNADIVTLLPELVAAYEEPFADPSSIPTYLVSRETRKHVTVALNGDGGDENFAGYIRYPILLFSEKWKSLPLPLHALAHASAHVFHWLKNDTLSYRGERFERTMRLPWERRYLQYVSFFTEEEKAAIYRDDVRFPRTDAWYAARTEAARARAHDLLHKAMAMDVDTYLADDLLPKVDLGSMAHALEARSPFLDHVLLEMTARIPGSLLVRGKDRKRILKAALRGIVPDATLDRPKRGFRLPLNRWFRGELKHFVEERLLGAPTAFWTFFDRRRVERFLAHYHASRIDYSDHVWVLLWLAEWMEGVERGELLQ
jgi:asparagine synthase (glutamine-hydrolysing)